MNNNNNNPESAAAAAKQPSRRKRRGSTILTERSSLSQMNRRNFIMRAVRQQEILKRSAATSAADPKKKRRMNNDDIQECEADRAALDNIEKLQRYCSSGFEELLRAKRAKVIMEEVVLRVRQHIHKTNVYIDKHLSVCRVPSTQPISNDNIIKMVLIQFVIERIESHYQEVTSCLYDNEEESVYRWYGWLEDIPLTCSDIMFSNIIKFVRKKIDLLVLSYRIMKSLLNVLTKYYKDYRKECDDTVVSSNDKSVSSSSLIRVMVLARRVESVIHFEKYAYASISNRPPPKISVCELHKMLDDDAYDILCRDEELIQCVECKKCICHHCFANMRHHHQQQQQISLPFEISCPYCRSSYFACWTDIDNNNHAANVEESLVHTAVTKKDIEPLSFVDLFIKRMVSAISSINQKTSRYIKSLLLCIVYDYEKASLSEASTTSSSSRSSLSFEEYHLFNYCIIMNLIQQYKQKNQPHDPQNPQNPQNPQYAIINNQYNMLFVRYIKKCMRVIKSNEIK